ncbi:flagellar biosynthesis protein FlhF [Aeribacillus alveayuensis]|uniref:Flagellar biosynthesis protein FlhF n=1 Tax=Aeribacillus alveayuensis TaxID=279215 RepID=A0ABT9VLA5_9BACI|nr:flagellar biosynthesis protein FlhF [Bacillus alveayuensis]
MIIKKYKAPTMQEAMKQIRVELGQDAVILNSKIVYSGGFFGLFKKKNVEVIAGVDEAVQSNAQKERQPSTLKDEMLPLFKEIKEMKQSIQSLQIEGEKLYPKELMLVDLQLKEAGFHSAIRSELMSSLMETYFLSRKNMTEEEILEELKNEIFKKIKHIPFLGITFQKKYINVVGPTGVGKTTTLAKLAAEIKLKHKKSIAFITTDTYRIAAIEQLKTYANILNAPVEVCYNINDFVRAKTKLHSYDIVFIDTAGRNFMEKQYIDDLQDVIDFNEELETYLIFSLTAKYEDMKKIFERFSAIPIHQFIFTKYDETSSHGAMLNMVLESNIGVGYLTDGQNVPDDIHQIDQKSFINYLLR